MTDFRFQFILMAMIEGRAISILRKAERQLQQLAAEAVSASNYVASIKVSGWAKAVHELAASARAGNMPSSSSPRRIRKSHLNENAAAQRGYPKFIRRGDELVRVAWSRRDKKEYQHKTPYITIKTLAAAILNAGKDGRLFTTEDVLPIRDVDDGSAIPNYQAYVGMAWLKNTGLIDQHGRKGYSVPKPEELLPTMESTWQSLPSQ